MDKLQELMDDISSWSDKQFDNNNFRKARCLPIAYHLKKEIIELIIALKMHDFTNHINDTKDFKKALAQTYKSQIIEEYADCLILLLDSAKHFGLDAKTLINITKKKLEINKEREWGEPDENGVVEHIKNNKE